MLSDCIWVSAFSSGIGLGHVSSDCVCCGMSSGCTCSPAPAFSVTTTATIHPMPICTHASDPLPFTLFAFALIAFSWVHFLKDITTKRPLMETSKYRVANKLLANKGPQRTGQGRVGNRKHKGHHGSHRQREAQHDVALRLLDFEYSAEAAGMLLVLHPREIRVFDIEAQAVVGVARVPEGTVGPTKAPFRHLLPCPHTPDTVMALHDDGVTVSVWRTDWFEPQCDSSRFHTERVQSLIPPATIQYTHWYVRVVVVVVGLSLVEWLPSCHGYCCCGAGVSMLVPWKLTQLCIQFYFMAGRLCLCSLRSIRMEVCEVCQRLPCVDGYLQTRALTPRCWARVRMVTCTSGPWFPTRRLLWTRHLLLLCCRLYGWLPLACGRVCKVIPCALTFASAAAVGTSLAPRSGLSSCATCRHIRSFADTM